MLYGIDGKIYKQIEVEKELAIPQYTISRIKNRALKKLRESIVIEE